MNKNGNEKNIELKPLGWLVIPDSIFDEGRESVNWINLYYDNRGKIVTPNTSQKDEESNESTEIKQRSFWERLKCLFTSR